MTLAGQQAETRSVKSRTSLVHGRADHLMQGVPAVDLARHPACFGTFGGLVNLSDRRGALGVAVDEWWS